MKDHSSLAVVVLQIITYLSKYSVLNFVTKTSFGEVRKGVAAVVRNRGKKRVCVFQTILR